MLSSVLCLIAESAFSLCEQRDDWRSYSGTGGEMEGERDGERERERERGKSEKTAREKSKVRERDERCDEREAMC
jgi:hypothetical protein